MVARGGSLNFIGALANGLLQFALVVVVTRALTKSASGAFFEAVALFLILSNTAELGADTGLTRMIPRYRVDGRVADVRRSLSVGLVPSFVAGVVLAAVSYALASPLAELFTNHRHADAAAVATYIRVLAVFVPLSSAYTVAIAATRGFGTMVPNALVDRIGKAAVQTLAVAVAVLAGGGSFAVAVAWGLPIGIAFAVALVWLGRLVQRVERRERPTKPATALRPLAREFWVFTAPRGMTGVFQVTTLWVGTLMVGSLMDTAHASIYTASTRYLVAGSVVNMAIIQVIGPKLSELLASGRPPAGDGRLPGGDGVADADGVADVPRPGGVRAAAPAGVQAPVRERGGVARDPRRDDARRDRDRPGRHGAPDGRPQLLEPRQRDRRPGREHRAQPDPHPAHRHRRRRGRMGRAAS